VALRKGSEFTLQQEAFIAALVSTGDKPYAARQAGYKNLNRAYDQPDHVIAEIDRRCRKLIVADLIPLGLWRVEKALKDEKTPFKEVAPVLKVLFGERSKDSAGLEKEPHEMSAAELGASIAELRVKEQALMRLAADKARPVLELEAIEDDRADSVFG
jgi:hypothetical protein